MTLVIVPVGDETVGCHSGIISGSLVPLRMLHYNIQGLSNKNIQLEVLLHDENIDIICLNENWLSECELNALSVRNYVCVSLFCRSVHRHGGVAIFARNSILGTATSNFLFNSQEIDFEVAGCLIKGILFVSLYRSPNGNFEFYLSSLEKLLDRL